jgi:hypothetical protein
LIGFWGIGDSLIEISFIESYRIKNKTKRVIVYSNPSLSFLFENISYIDQVEIVSHRMYYNFNVYSHVLFWLIKLMHHRVLLVYPNPKNILPSIDISNLSIIEVLELTVFNSKFNSYFNSSRLKRFLVNDNPYNLNKMAVLINLDSNSLNIQNKQAYSSLAKVFIESGYKVFVNGNQLNGVDKLINISNQDLVSVLKLAMVSDYVVSVRSGLADIIFNLDRKTIVVYPNSKSGNWLKKTYSLRMWNRENDLMELMEEELFEFTTIEEINSRLFSSKKINGFKSNVDKTLEWT